MNTYTINGEKVKSLDDLYAEFARAVNAPDQYFGKCLQSFDDCLFGGFGLETPCKIIWNNSEVSRAFLDCNALERHCLSIIENSPFLNEPGYEDGLTWVNETLNAARAGKQSLFDEVVELIASVTNRATWDHSIDLQLK